jgi:hypothetical protein
MRSRAFLQTPPTHSCIRGRWTLPPHLPPSSFLCLSLTYTHIRTLPNQKSQVVRVLVIESGNDIFGREIVSLLPLEWQYNHGIFDIDIQLISTCFSTWKTYFRHEWHEQIPDSLNYIWWIEFRRSLCVKQEHIMEAVVRSSYLWLFLRCGRATSSFSVQWSLRKPRRRWTWRWPLRSPRCRFSGGCAVLSSSRGVGRHPRRVGHQGRQPFVLVFHWKSLIHAVFLVDATSIY